jgi:hypothetical protein
MQPLTFDQDEDQDDGVIDLDSYDEKEPKQSLDSSEEEESDGVVDMDQYEDSGEAQEWEWWDLAKDLIVQPALGAAGAYTWPADILKIGMVGEALSDIDELEEAFKKEGKPFDKTKYIQEVAKTSQFIPTQELLEDTFTEKTGLSLEPKSPFGKGINKFFRLAALARGRGFGKEVLKKAAKAGAVGVGTTEALKAAGANETAAEITGDIGSGFSNALKKSPKVFSKEIAELEKTATKHALPFPEYLTKEATELAGPKITEGRRAALQKNLGMSSEEAINKVIEGKLPVSKLRQQGADLEVLYNDAYDKSINLAKQNKTKASTQDIIGDIDSEIARIKKNAPSPSDADRAAIDILQTEKQRLSKAPPKVKNPILGPNGQPVNPPSDKRIPKEASAEELIKQVKNYNSNVKQLYKRPEFSGREDAVRGAYAFLNNSIRNTIESHAGSDVRNSMKAADSLFGEVAKLDRVEGMVSKAFANGDYNPKKLNQLLNSKQGLIVRRELGDQAVNEIRDIAKYGERAINATNQLAKSGKYAFEIGEWGPLAGFMLAKMPKTAGVLLAAKPMANNIRGYLLTNPASRTVYKDILKNAANGSFKNMQADFAKIEKEIYKDYGSMDDFMKSMQEDIDFYVDE